MYGTAKSWYVYYDKSKDKNNIAIIIEDTNGNVFGCYSNSISHHNINCIKEKEYRETYLFSLQSNKRLEGLMLFTQNEMNQTLRFFSKESNTLFIIVKELSRNQQKHSGWVCKKMWHFFKNNCSYRKRWWPSNVKSN